MHFEFGQSRLTQRHALSPLELAPGRGHKPSRRISGQTRSLHDQMLVAESKSRRQKAREPTLRSHEDV